MDIYSIKKQLEQEYANLGRDDLLWLIVLSQHNKAKMSGMADLPTEIQFEVAYELPMKDVLNLCQTNTQLAEMCRTPGFWRQYIIRRHNVPKDSELLNNKDLAALKNVAKTLEYLSPDEILKMSDFILKKNTQYIQNLAKLLEYVLFEDIVTVYELNHTYDHEDPPDWREGPPRDSTTLWDHAVLTAAAESKQPALMKYFFENYPDFDDYADPELGYGFYSSKTRPDGRHQILGDGLVDLLINNLTVENYDWVKEFLRQRNLLNWIMPRVILETEFNNPDLIQRILEDYPDTPFFMDYYRELVEATPDNARRVARIFTDVYGELEPMQKRSLARRYQLVHNDPQYAATIEALNDELDLGLAF